MRTLLIAPSFLTVFVISVFSVGWLITSGGQGSPNTGAMPSRAAFTAWADTMPVHRSWMDPSRAAAKESVDELGSH